MKKIISLIFLFSSPLFAESTYTYEVFIASFPKRVDSVNIKLPDLNNYGYANHYIPLKNTSLIEWNNECYRLLVTPTQQQKEFLDKVELTGAIRLIRKQEYISENGEVRIESVDYGEPAKSKGQIEFENLVKGLRN